MKKNGQFPNVRVEYGFGAVWSGHVRECLLVQLVSVDFNYCINSAWEICWRVLDCIWTVSLDVYGVWVCGEHNPQCIYVIQRTHVELNAPIISGLNRLFLAQTPFFYLFSFNAF